MSLKRFAAPAFWPIEKKTKKFVVKPRPGAHKKSKCIPLGLVIRDILKCARTMKEINLILNAGHVKVDNIVRKEKGFAVGIMDIVTVGDESYRILPGKKGLHLIKIGKEESVLKLLKIVDKRSVKKGRVQLNFNDGKNILADNGYKTNDTLVFDIVQKKIKDTIKLEKGCTSLVTGGKNMGALVTIDEIIVTQNSMPNQIVVNLEGKKFMLPRNYVFAVGKDKPVIKIGETR